MKTRNKMVSAVMLIFFMMVPPGISVFSEGTEVVVSNGESIQKAVDAAKPGAVIIVEKGIYEGNIQLTKSVMLHGEEATIKGDGMGSVITVEAPETSISGFTITNSGKMQKDAGIMITSSDNRIQDNRLQQVQVGIYVDEADGNTLIGNQISSFPAHFSMRGNGIHLYKGERNIVKNNVINQVQDGVYFDFEKNSEVTGNVITGGRYGLHFMFADGGSIDGNRLEHNINGLMIMGSRELTFTENKLNKQLNFRGYGALIFDSDHIVLRRNELTYNSTGISLQDARDSRIERNVIAGNHVGLHLKNENERNVLTENNFSGNVIQTRVAALNESLDNGSLGNYWDDYRGLDMDGDAIGEIPYESGTMFDKMLMQYPELQFYFQSPSIKMWDAVEKVLPSFASDKGMDRFPAVRPFPLFQDGEEDKTTGWTRMGALLLSFTFLSLSGLIIYRGGVRK